MRRLVEAPRESCYTTGVNAGDPSSAKGAPTKPADTGHGGSASATARGTAAKKPPASKEPPVFQWKLVGYSRGIPLTLLKCVERSDAETQLERYQAEGYYGELAIHAIDAKIPIPQEMLEWISRQEEAKAAAAQKKTSVSKRPSRAKKTAAKGESAAKRSAAPKKAAEAKPKAKPPAKVKVKKKTKAKTKGKTTPKARQKARAAPRAKASAAKKKAAKRTTRRSKTKKKAR